MSGPPLLADENYPVPTIEALRPRGLAVARSVDFLPQGAPDAVVFREAARRERVLVSANYTQRRQFEALAVTLREEGWPFVAAILPPHEPPTRRLLLRTLMLLAWRRAGGTADVLTWGRLAQALIHGLALPGFTDEDRRVALGHAPA